MSVGGYRLSPALKEEFFDFTSFSGDEQPEQGDVKLHGGMYYLTRDIYNPDIGDLRIQFYFAGRAGEMVRVGEGVEGGGTGGEKGGRGRPYSLMHDIYNPDIGDLGNAYLLLW